MQEKYEALMRQIEAYRTADPLLYLRGLAIAKSLPIQICGLYAQKPFARWRQSCTAP